MPRGFGLWVLVAVFYVFGVVMSVSVRHTTHCWCWFIFGFAVMLCIIYVLVLVTFKSIYLIDII